MKKFEIILGIAYQDGHWESKSYNIQAYDYLEAYYKARQTTSLNLNIIVHIWLTEWYRIDEDEKNQMIDF
jgi:hypothetical protein